MNWKQIFNNKVNDGNFDLKKMLSDNGMQIEFCNYKQSFQYFLNLNPTNVLEIGCGVGLNLFLFYENKSNVCGIDYAENAISMCKKIMPNGKFEVSEANNIPFNEKFDLVLCNSVFQYFNDIAYAKNTIVNILNHLQNNGMCVISDIFDIELKEEYKKFRMKELNIDDSEWKIRYSKLKHLYYDKNELKKYVNSLGYKIDIIQPSFYLSNHKNFRFDIRIYK